MVRARDYRFSTPGPVPALDSKNFFSFKIEETLTTFVEQKLSL